MIPETISKQLADLRGRERLLQFSWGAARWLALFLSLLFLACLTDWAIDRNQETPWALRRSLLMIQLVAGLGAAGALLLWPLRKKLSDAEMALWVEDQTPALGHRLITAVQLNQEGAMVEGMSRELIQVVTREAEQATAPIPCARIADHRRLKWSLLTLGLTLLLAALPIILWPGISGALLARQLLLDAEIPRSIYLDNVTQEVWPAGETVLLQIRARGEGLHEDLEGKVTVSPEGRPSDQITLAFKKWEGEDEGKEAIYTAQVPALPANFTFRARLGDGRLGEPGEVRFEPRPVVEDIQSWHILPDYCNKNKDGIPHEVPQPTGDIIGISPDGKLPTISQGKVQIKIQKPVNKAVMQLWGPADPKNPQDSPEVLKRELAMALSEAGTEADIQFPLKKEETSFYILVQDSYGFDNRPPPRRKLRIVPEDAPTVTLLKEMIPGLERVERAADELALLIPLEGDVINKSLEKTNSKDLERIQTDILLKSLKIIKDLDQDEGIIAKVASKELKKTVENLGNALEAVSNSDYALAVQEAGAAMKQWHEIHQFLSRSLIEGEVEGIPFRKNDPIPIAYSCFGPYGLGYARMKYRVVKKRESGVDGPADLDWQPFDLVFEPALKGSVFLPNRGRFLQSDPRDQVYFHYYFDENIKPWEYKGGGSFRFQTDNLKDKLGARIDLQEGDQIEFYIEVHAGKKGQAPDPTRPVARSEPRIKTVVSNAEFERWFNDTLREEAYIRRLFKEQGGLFPGLK